MNKRMNKKISEGINEELGVYLSCRDSSWTIESQDTPRSSVSKESACNAGDPGSFPRSGRSTGERNGNLLQYSCLENPMDRGTWWAIVHGVTKSQTQLSDWTTTNKLLFTYCLICPRFVLWELLQPGSWVVWPCFRHILSTFFTLWHHKVFLVLLVLCLSQL